MARNRIQTWTIGSTVCALMVLWAASPAWAGPRDRGGRGRQARAPVSHHGASQKKHDDSVSVSVRLGSGFERPHRPVQRRWVPGHWEVRKQRVLVEAGHYERQWVPPVYERRYDDYGEPYRVLICEGYYRKVWVPARYEIRRVRTWAPGYWVAVERHGRHRPRPRPNVHSGITIRGTFNF